ncbi:coenzyme A pyrophosphatase [Actinocatenispora comari]|uniref:Coenzyme A pyrophosphatase n=1 Tax=Actinocatenispora comari TaxID=2807577 RepID=A0A8J4AE05_9ACTN|nr:coenzyme A pyrophosphatase [Actinocatenispora comari]
MSAIADDPATGLPGWWQPLLTRVGALRPEAFGEPTPSARRSAVLILLADGPAGPDVVILQRASTLRDHPGQCAFPGGGVEPTDGGPAGTALREAGEEVGVRADTVQVVGTLPELYLNVSDFRVTPVLAWWRSPHRFGDLDPGEVARVARLPLAGLADPANRLRVRHPSGYVGAAFRLDGMLVWGFTGGILARLLDLGGWARAWDTTRVEPLPPGF